VLKCDDSEQAMLICINLKCHFAVFVRSRISRTNAEIGPRSFLRRSRLPFTTRCATPVRCPGRGSEIGGMESVHANLGSVSQDSTQLVPRVTGQVQHAAALGAFGWLNAVSRRHSAETVAAAQPGRCDAGLIAPLLLPASRYFFLALRRLTGGISTPYARDAGLRAISAGGGRRGCLIVTCAMTC
jgi:hypothetical protein